MNESGHENNLPFPGKLAVITVVESINKEDFHSAGLLIKKYGPDKVIHSTWPENFMAEQDRMSAIVAAIAADMEVKVLIVNQALPGTNAAVNLLKKNRDDIFVIYFTVQESYTEAAACANLIFMYNNLGMAPEMVKQAKKHGAKAFVHYSFPRHLSLPMSSTRCRLIKENCAAEGIQFISAITPDPADENGIFAARQFILEDVPKMVARYGEDTAFFCTNCHMQIPLIKAIVDCRAIYPQPCCPSPYHGFPEALGIETGEGLGDLSHIINEISNIVAERNMSDRLSTWPLSGSMMYTSAAAEYAIKRINGEVSRNHIDDRILEDCMKSYIKEVVGEGVEVTMTSYSESGISYDNFKLILMSYLDF